MSGKFHTNPITVKFSDITVHNKVLKCLALFTVNPLPHIKTGNFEWTTHNGSSLALVLDFRLLRFGFMFKKFHYQLLARNWLIIFGAANTIPGQIHINYWRHPHPLGCDRFSVPYKCPASHYFFFTRIRASWIFFGGSLIIIRRIPVRNPFIGVSRHIQYPVGGSAGRETASFGHRCCATVYQHPGCVYPLVPPRIRPAVRSACRFFPFCLGWQPAPNPFAISTRLNPINPDYRIIGILIVIIIIFDII